MRLSPRTQRTMAASGMLAPITFIVLAGVATLLTPDYSLFSETVSGLASPGRPYWWLVNASFVLYCLLVQPLGPLLFAAVPSRIGGTLLWLLIVQYGAGSSLAAVYRAADDRAAWGTLTADEVHYLVARIGFLAILALSFVTPLVLRGLPEWRQWRRYSLTLALLTVLFVLPFQLGVLSEWRGAFQRGFFATTLLWVFGTSFQFYRLAHQAGQPTEKSAPREISAFKR